MNPFVRKCVWKSPPILSYSSANILGRQATWKWGAFIFKLSFADPQVCKHWISGFIFNSAFANLAKRHGSMDVEISKAATSPEWDKENQHEETEKKKKGMALLIYDLKHRELFPIKLLTFILFAGIGSLFSFFSIHMKSLGITVEEMGLINGVSSVVSIFIPFLLGLIADKVGNFKVMMSVMITFLVGITLLFLVVPVGRISKKFPLDMTLAMGCDYDMNDHQSASLVLTDLDSNACHLKSANDNQSETNVSFILEECGYVCYNQNRSSEYNEGLGTIPLEMEEVTDVEATEEFRDAIFFPKDLSLNVSCLNETCIANIQSGYSAGSRNGILGLIPPVNSLNATGIFSVSWMALESNEGQKMNNVQCNSYTEGQKLHQQFYYHRDLNQTDNSNTVYPLCLPQCIFRANRSDLCSNMAAEEIFNPQLTFGLFMFLRFLFEFFTGALDLFVGASVAIVNKVGGDYGFQRMFGFVGIAIFSPISGALIDYFSPNSEAHGSTRPAFYLFAALYGIAVIVMLTINLDFKPPTKNPIRNVKALLKNVELDMLLFAGLISGILGGYGAFWLFPFLEEIEGTRSLMGLSNTLQSVVSIPLLIFSTFICRKLSYPNVIFICFSINVFRLIGYSYLYNPKWCLLFEPMEAIASTFLRTSLITYANQLGTTSTVASIQGLLSGVTYGLGSAISSYGGSLLIAAYGQRVTFRILGVTSFLSGFTYLLFNFFYLRPKNNQLTISNNVTADLDGKIQKSH